MIKKLGLILIFMATTISVAIAVPKENEDGGFECNIDGCTSVTNQPNGTWVCDSSGCTFFPTKKRK